LEYVQFNTRVVVSFFERPYQEGGEGLLAGFFGVVCILKNGFSTGRNGLIKTDASNAVKTMLKT
jgi:hypothetical protein